MSVTLTGCLPFNGGAGTKVTFKITGSNSQKYKVYVRAGVGASQITDMGYFYGATSTGDSFPTTPFVAGSCAVWLG